MKQPEYKDVVWTFGDYIEWNAFKVILMGVGIYIGVWILRKYLEFFKDLFKKNV